MTAPTTDPRTYDIRTHGCQMNVHDSERLAGLMETAGYVDLASVPLDVRPEVADVVVFNTCAVRENADNKLYGNLGQLRPAKTANPDLQIAVGGCMAQKDRSTIVDRAPWVDVADPPGLRLRRVGVDLGRLQQHLHVLHRAGPEGQGAGPQTR